MLLLLPIPSFILTWYTNTRLAILFWHFPSVIVPISFSYCSSKKGTFWKIFFLIISIQAIVLFICFDSISLIKQTVISKCCRSLKCIGITDNILALSKSADLLEISLCCFKSKGIVSLFFLLKIRQLISLLFRNDRTNTSISLIKCVYVFKNIY